jgi:hypothetical protein
MYHVLFEDVFRAFFMALCYLRSSLADGNLLLMCHIDNREIISHRGIKLINSFDDTLSRVTVITYDFLYWTLFKR